MQPEDHDHLHDNAEHPNESPYEFEGQCAFAVSTGKLGVTGSPDHTIEANGRTYTFKNGAARFLWKALPGRAARADLVWRGAAGRA